MITKLLNIAVHDSRLPYHIEVLGGFSFHFHVAVYGAVYRTAKSRINVLFMGSVLGGYPSPVPLPGDALYSNVICTKTWCM